MNKEFRVWNPKTKTWLDGCWMYQSGALDHDTVFAWELQNCVAQYFTGLTDSSGQKIFEGDILEELIQNESSKQIGICKQVLGGWKIFSHPDPSICWHGWKQKVIGNIFERPELLK